MGKRGPKPMAPGLKALKGGPRPPVAGKIPASAPGVPLLPTDLDGEALGEWDRFAAIVARDSRLTEAEAPAFALYCRAYALNRKAFGEAILSAAITTDSGAEKANPAAAVFLKSADLMLKVLAAFGLTPAARAALGHSEPGEPDPLDVFLAKTRKA
jgi:P27 family predicted phage terminase small subunit